MEDLSLGFEKLKISAFSKYSKLTGNIHNVTIGPNSTIYQDVSHSEKDKTPESSPRKSPTKEKSPDSTSPLLLSQVLNEYEMQRREKVQKAIDEHYNNFRTFTKSQKEKENQWLNKQQDFIQNVQKHEELVLQSLIQQDVDRSKQNRELRKHYEDMLHRKQQYEEQLEKQKEKQRLLNETMEKIKKYQLEFRSVYQEIILSIKSCDSSEELKKQLGDNFRLLKTLPEAFDEIITKCKTHNVGEEQLTKASEIIIHIKNLKLQIEECVLKINNKKKEPAQVVDQQTIKEQEPVNVKQSEVGNAAPVLNQCVSISNLKKYLEMKEFLTQYCESFKELLNSEQLKQFRFDCKKAVNIPVNAISAVNSEHLKDKYIKLNNLLSGKTVFVADKQINASRHPQGIPFCTDLLAKKFVLQGDLMISSNPEAAYCYATIIVSLWNDFPNFGKLLLAYFYTQCPYLVPFYIPKTDDQSNEDYYMSLGYRYTDGQIEKQDKFLKRMTGILRLYFAIMIAKPKRDQAKNPHDIKNAWIFLASLLKMDPMLDITATSLHIFLETVGFEMENVYGLVFKKVVRIIMEKFIPLLKTIDTGGPVTRLEVLLQDYKTKGHFEKPNGVLAPNFW